MPWKAPSFFEFKICCITEWCKRALPTSESSIPFLKKTGAAIYIPTCPQHYLSSEKQDNFVVTDREWKWKGRGEKKARVATSLWQFKKQPKILQPVSESQLNKSFCCTIKCAQRLLAIKRLSIKDIISIEGNGKHPSEGQLRQKECQSSTFGFCNIQIWACFACFRDKRRLYWFSFASQWQPM